jgi:hypothetical protein
VRKLYTNFLRDAIARDLRREEVFSLM